ETLRSMGADSKTIANIFVIEGCIISTIGAVAGIATGLLLCFVQQEFSKLPA
ncbi:MAG: FtsX-like permease family protein, partial [Clostridia bacterium]|nr:FtsX-like permease family protein [Clostridia bacterium]